MKKLLLLLLLALPLSLAAQRGSNAGKIPVYGNQVLFRDSISSLSYNNKERLRNNLITGINAFLAAGKNRQGILVTKDTAGHKLVAQISDYLLVEEKALSTYGIWTKYLLEIDYSGKETYVEVKNIVFVDQGDKKKEKERNPDRFNEDAFTAEEMFLSNKYRIAFVKDASKKVADKFMWEVHDLLTDLKNNIN